MFGPGDDEEEREDLYETRDGRQVEHDELTDAERSYYEDGGHGQATGIDLENYVRNWEQSNCGLAVDDEGNWKPD